jgi:hypothetical protein
MITRIRWWLAVHAARWRKRRRRTPEIDPHVRAVLDDQEVLNSIIESDAEVPTRLPQAYRKGWSK